MSTFKVFRPSNPYGIGEEDLIEADHVSVSTSGALMLSQEHGRYLVHAYAPGQWREVIRVADKAKPKARAKK